MTSDKIKSINLSLLIMLFFCIASTVFSQSTPNLALTGFAKFNELTKFNQQTKSYPSFSAACSMMFDQETDSNKKAFWLYYKLINDRNSKRMDFIELMGQYPTAVFPQKDYLEGMEQPWLQPFIVAGQKMEPSIEFEMVNQEAEKIIRTKVVNHSISPSSIPAGGSITPQKEADIDVKTIEVIYEQLITGCRNSTFHDADGIPFLVTAYAYLFKIKEALNENDTCILCDRILTETPNIGYRITKWGQGDNLHFEAIEFKIKNCTCSPEEKISLFEKLFSENIGDCSWTHGGMQRCHDFDIFKLLSSFELDDQTQIVKKIIQGKETNNYYKGELCLHLAYVEYQQGDNDAAKKWCEEYLEFVDQKNPKTFDKEKYKKVKKIIHNGFEPLDSLSNNSDNDSGISPYADLLNYFCSHFE